MAFRFAFPTTFVVSAISLSPSLFSPRFTRTGVQEDVSAVVGASRFYDVNF